MTDAIANVSKLSREDWLKLRQLGIGGSDAAAACGLSHWKSQAQLFLEKTSKIEISDNESEALRQGRDFEDYVAKRFTEATGKKVRRDNFMMADNEYPFLIADIDRRVVGEDAILECKTTSPYNRYKWEDGAIPIEYELQCLHYMSVTGAKKCYLACLVFGSEFIIREINWDDETIKMLRDKEIEFWTEYVEKNVMPDPDGSVAFDDALKARFKGGIEDSIRLDADLNSYEIYKANKDLIKDLEDRNRKFEQDLKIQLADNNYGETSYFTVSYKPSISVRLDTQRIKKEAPEIYDKYGKESESRRFLIKEIVSE